MKNKCLSFLPLFILLLVWFVFSSPYFLRHRVPYPSDYQVNNFHPWNRYKQFLGPVKNDAMPDIVDQIFPWKHFTIESIKNGSIPLWNPYSFAGTPHLANYQSSVFSPFNILYFFFPFIDAWSVTILLQPLIAGVCTYMFLRKLQRSTYASALGGITFMFCGFIVVWMEYSTVSMAIAFLPFSLFVLESFFQKRKILLLFFLYISVPLSFFAGHFQTSVYFFLFLLLYALFRSMILKENKAGLVVFLALTLGLLAASVQIFPSIELYYNSVRSGIFRSNGGIPFYYLVTLFAPDFFGNPSTHNNWFGYYAEWASFVGIIPLFLSLISMYERKNRIVIFFIIVTFFTLLLALNTPLTGVLKLVKIPVLSTGGSSRIIVLTSFCLSILAGFGLDYFEQILRKRSGKKLIFPLLISGLLIALGLSLARLLHFSSQTLSVAKHNMYLPTGLFILILFLTILPLVLENKKVITSILLIILIFSAVDSFRFAQKWIPFESAQTVFPNLAVIQSMQKSIGFGRAFGNFGAYLDTYYHLSSIEGYDPLYPKRYGEFVVSAQNGKLQEAERSVVKLQRRGMYTNRVLDFLAVNILYHPILDTNKSWAYPVWSDKKRFTLIYKDNNFQIFRNNSAMDRLSLFYNYQITKNPSEEISTFYSNNFDFRNTVLLEQDIGKHLDSGKGKVLIKEINQNKIRALVETNATAFLFLPTTFYPGWKAYIDYKEQKIYRADYAFQGIFITKGTHDVTFTYFPSSFLLGEFTSAASFFLLGVVIIFLKRGGHKKS